MASEQGKWTPGPWRLEVQFSDDGGTDYALLGAEGEVVAHLTAAYGNDREHADVRLLAAAHTMQDALQAVERYLAPRLYGTGGDGETRVLPIIRAALRKAQGESA